MNLDERVAKLETHFEYIRRDLDSIRAGQERVLDQLNGLATKTDLRWWTVQWIAICIMAIGVVVGGIIGGLSWIKADTAAPTVLTTTTTPSQ